ncbi:MAG: TetR family transcriptional regulator [Mycobacterium sp.]
MTVGSQRARSEGAKRQRRLDLLAAAEELATRDGVGAVTLAEVTAAAGLHPSAMRRYFESKEELLLELTERGWCAWRDALVGRLRERTALSATDVADAVVDALIEQPLFCDLITHAPLTLEDGVNRGRAVQFKTTAFGAYADMAETLAAASDGLDVPAAQDVLTSTLALTAYLWQVAHPGPVLASIYAEIPAWGHAATHFSEELRRLIRQMVLGTTLRGESSRANP